jgi:hypothetical protein
MKSTVFMDNPQTTRAAAAAAEIANLWLRICKEPPCGCDECQEDMAGIIAKHFNDDALRLAAGRALELVSALQATKPKNLAQDHFSIAMGYEDHVIEDFCDAVITALSAALAGDKGKE